MPDPKVIGKISSTLEEIRDILLGTKPSKLYNSIQSIASTNIAMSELMKELVEDTKENKEIKLKDAVIGSKKSDDLMKSANKTMLNISETLSTISDNVKSIKKKAGLSLRNSDDRKVLNDIIRDTQKDSNGNKLLGMINVITQLQHIKISDLFAANLKVNKIEKIYDKLLGVFEKINGHKDIKPKELNDFALNAITIVRKLAKIAYLSKFAQMGAEAIDKVFLGKHGLVGTLVKMKKHEKEIKRAKKMTNDLFIITGKLFGVSLLLTGIALLGVTAMAGVIMAAGMIVVLGGAMALLGVFEKPIRKGNLVVVGLMTAMVLAGAGLWLLNKGTKDLEWEQLGMAATAIVGFGLIAALLGTPVVFGFVGLGCIALSLMGIALVAIGGGVALFGLLVTDDAISKVANGIPRIFTAMTSIFGDEKPGNASFGDTVMGLVTGSLRLGGSLFAAGALIVMGISLGILGLCLRSWEDFDTKAIDNIEYATGKLDKIFGLDVKGQNKSFGGALFDTFTAPIQVASTLLSNGKIFVKMGTLLFAGVVLGLIKNSIDKWKNFDTSSLDNVDIALTRLDDMFDLGIKRKSVAEDVIVGAVDTITSPFQIASTLLKAGKTFVKLGTLMAGVFVVDYTIERMRKWKNFDASCLDNVLSAVKKFGDFFGIQFGEKKPNGFIENVVGGIGNIISGAVNTVAGTFQMGSALLQAGKEFLKLGVLSIAVGVVDKMVGTMLKVANSGKQLDGALDPVFGAFDKMIDYFFNDDRLDMSMWDGIRSLGKVALGAMIAGPVGALGATLLASDDRKTKLSILTTAVGVVERMSEAIINMSKYSKDVSSGLDVTFEALNKLVDYLFGKPDDKGAGALARIGKAMSANSKEASFTAFGAIAGGVLGGPVGALIGGGLGYLIGDDGSGALNTQLEILVTCVGIVATMANALSKMKDLSPNIDTAIDKVFYALEKITDYFFGDADGTQAGALARVGKAMIKARLGSFLSGDFLTSFFGNGSGKIETQLELITSCVGIVSQVADTVSKMSDTENVDTAIDNLTGSLDKIIDYVLGYTEDDLDDIDDIADEFHDITDHLVKCADVFDGKEQAITNLENFANKGMPSIRKIIRSMNFGKDGEDYLDSIEDVADELPGIFGSLGRALDKINGDYEDSIKTLDGLYTTMGKFSFGDIAQLRSAGSAFGDLTNSLINYCNLTDERKINKLNALMNKFINFANLNNADMFAPVNKVVDKINTIDIEKANALKDTFKSFTDMNTFGGFFFNFKKQVGLFTEACVRLIDAINGNTEALTTENIMDEAENATPEPSKKAVAIANVKELADQIADAINGNGFGGGFGEAIPVELRINGDGGDSWVIRKY